MTYDADGMAAVEAADQTLYFAEIDGYERADVLPLGSGALAGVPYDLDREAVADELGFSCVSANSLDAVSEGRPAPGFGTSWVRGEDEVAGVPGEERGARPDGMAGVVAKVRHHQIL